MQTHQLSSRLVRPGCRTITLDAEKGKAPKFPWMPGAKRKKDRHNTLQQMRRIGRMSMIQIGDDEFRTTNRRERRAAGIRHGNKHVLATIASKRGTAHLRTCAHPYQ